MNFLDTTLIKKTDQLNVTIAYIDHVFNPEEAPAVTFNVPATGFKVGTLSKHLESYSTEMTLGIKKKTFELGTLQIVTKMAKEQMNLMNKNGTDVESMLDNILRNEDEQGVAKTLYGKYANLGVKNAEKFKTTRQKLVEKWLKTTSFPVYLGKDSKKNTDYIKAKVLTTYIISCANKIGSTSRRGSGDFAIVNIQVGSLIQDSSLFSFSPIEKENFSSNTPIYYIGNIAHVKIFVNSNLKYSDMTIVIGRTTKEHEPGVIIAEQEPSIKITFDENGDMIATRKSRRAYCEVGNNPESCYYTSTLIMENKPLWRKLFKI